MLEAVVESSWFLVSIRKPFDIRKLPWDHTSPGAPRLFTRHQGDGRGYHTRLHVVLLG